MPDDLEGYAALTRGTARSRSRTGSTSSPCRFRRDRPGAPARVLQFDTNRVGGITQAVKVCALAEGFGLDVVPHAGQVHNYHVVASQPALPDGRILPARGDRGRDELPHWLFDGEPLAENGRVRSTNDRAWGSRSEPRDPVREVSLR